MNTVLTSTCIFDSCTDQPYCGYIELKGNRINAVGKGALPERYQNTGYEVIDCGNKTITAGICDSHVHLFLGALEASTINVYHSISADDAASKLYQYYGDNPDGWVIGFGWSNYRWPGNRLPEKESLDTFFPDRPAVVFNDELHALWVNSKALNICGITKETPDPKGGIIFRNQHGEPSGYLLEQSAMSLVTEHALKFSKEQEKALVHKFMEKAHQMGVTAVGDVQVLGITKEKLLKELEDSKNLRLRVFFAPAIETSVEEALSLKEGYCSDKLAFLGLKGFIDGTPMGYTGLMIEDYADRPGFRGGAVLDLEWLEKHALALYENNIAMRLHACGDGAVRAALDIIAAAEADCGRKEIRNTIEHVEVIHPSDLHRFAETGTIASIQPSHMIMENLETHPIFSILDPERIKLAWPGKSLTKAGAIVAFGTDYPIVDLNPIDTLYRATTRVMENDLPMGGWNPQEKFTLGEAIKNATINTAFLLGAEKRIGSLEPGKLADLIVFSDNLFFIDSMEFPKLSVEMTIFDGMIVYQK